jgi:hypothetical protein
MKLQLVRMAFLLSSVTAGQVCGQSLPVCLTHDLSIRLVYEGAGMGQIVRDFVLTNDGSHACKLSGYPKAVALNEQLAVVHEIPFVHCGASCGPGIENENQRVHIIRLKPGAHAWFQISSSDGMGLEDVSFCHKATQVRVTPPGNDKPFPKLLPFVACTPGAGISFLLPGESPFEEGSEAPSSGR